MNFTVWLRAFREEDAVLVNKLRYGSEMEKLIGGSKRFVSLAKDREWVKALSLANNTDPIYLAICDKKSDAIGYTSISNVDFRVGTCFWSGIKIDSHLAGKGLGFEAELLILKYCFEELRMVRVSAQGLEEHEVAIKFMEKAGFKKEGLMRKYVYKDGKHHNVWLFSITDDDYKEIKEKYEL